jgi:hypothetical protein
LVTWVEFIHAVPILALQNIDSLPNAQSPVPTWFPAVAAHTAHNNKPRAANYVESGGAAMAAPFFLRYESV